MYHIIFSWTTWEHISLVCFALSLVHEMINLPSEVKSDLNKLLKFYRKIKHFTVKLLKLLAFIWQKLKR